MSLELALAANTDALNAVAALLKESNEGRVVALETLKAAAENGDKPASRAAGRPTAAEKKAAAAAATPAAEPAADTPVEVASEAVATVDALRAAAVAFNSTDDPTEHARRKDFIRAVIAEVGIPEDDAGKVKVVNANAEDRQKIIDWFAAFAAGEKVNFQADDGAVPEEAEEDDIG
jgi:hypothetical protein